jgi:diacylglycerol kinase family enzyme
VSFHEHIAVIINAGSGSVDDAALMTRIRESFSARGILPRFLVCAPGQDIRRHAEEAVRSGCTTLVAGGGDGTVSTVASVVTGTDAVLGLLPLGTLNHFAKDTGIPLELDEAVGVIAAGHFSRVDVGEVNGRTFLNNSSLGLYPRIVGRRQAEQRLGRSKWWAFTKGVLTVLGRYPLLRVVLACDGTEIRRTTPFVFIGNNEYEIHGFSIGTRARIDSGALSVYTTHRMGRSGLLILLLRALVGRLRDAQDFDTISATEVQVAVGGKAVRVAIDGEVTLMSPPLLYRSRKEALRVLLPGIKTIPADRAPAMT